MCPKKVLKKIKLKEISVAVIASSQPMGCARAGRCCDLKALAHTRLQFKYTIFEHVHLKGMKVYIALTHERDARYFFPYE